MITFDDICARVVAELREVAGSCVSAGYKAEGKQQPRHHRECLAISGILTSLLIAGAGCGNAIRMGVDHSNKTGPF